MEYIILEQISNILILRVVVAIGRRVDNSGGRAAARAAHSSEATTTTIPTLAYTADRLLLKNFFVYTDQPRLMMARVQYLGSTYNFAANIIYFVLPRRPRPTHLPRPPLRRAAARAAHSGEATTTTIPTRSIA